MVHGAPTTAVACALAHADTGLADNEIYSQQVTLLYELIMGTLWSQQ